MAETMILIGAEDVRQGGASMVSAARSITEAVGYLGATLDLHRRLQEDQLVRFEAAVDKLAGLAPAQSELEEG